MIQGFRWSVPKKLPHWPEFMPPRLAAAYLSLDVTELWALGLDSYQGFDCALFAKADLDAWIVSETRPYPGVEGRHDY